MAAAAAGRCHTRTGLPAAGEAPTDLDGSQQPRDRTAPVSASRRAAALTSQRRRRLSRQVVAQFVDFDAPQGLRFLTPSVAGVRKASCLALADVGGSPTFEARYLPEPNDGGAGGVRADVLFNTMSSIDAFLGSSSVVEVLYDARGDASRQTVTYKLPRKLAGEGYDVRRAELFIGRRRQERAANGDFLKFELYRQVTNTSRQTTVGDYEVISRFHRVNDQLVTVQQRVAAFLQPQDAAYFEVGSKAVAIYDYNLTMTKL
eukprot:SM000193S05174  [mRNA]  locus=s193:113921:115871:+ [translate_table: standard]